MSEKCQTQTCATWSKEGALAHTVAERLSLSVWWNEEAGG